MTSWRLRSARRLTLFITASLPLLVWPELARPFSTPKLWVLLLTTLIVLALAWRPWSESAHPPADRWPFAALPALWLASWIGPSLFGEVVSLDAVLTGIASGLWGLALFAARPPARHLMAATVVGGSGVALIALLQWIGFDPFVAFGWLPRIQGASTRMRVYATLGNPNYVAALLAATAPLTAAAVLMLGRLARAAAAVALILQCAAIAATGSRAGALGLVAAAVVWAAVFGLARTVIVAGAVLLATGIALSSEGRPLRQTLDGRMYMWNVAARGAWTHPWVGHGPGGVEAHYVEWERDRYREEAPIATTDRFSRPEQHAHNDYLEALVERGVPGLLALAVVIVLPVAGAIRHVPGPGMAPLTAGAASAVAAIAAVAAVDYPMTRPGELVIFWSAVAIVAITLTGDR